MARLARVDEIAALDPINEVAVQKAVTALTRDKTVIVVAHRQQTVRNADQILVLHDDRIAERGTHDELLDLGGWYADFWHQRDRAAGWRPCPDAPAEPSGPVGVQR